MFREGGQFRNLTLEEFGSIKERELSSASMQVMDTRLNRPYRFSFLAISIPHLDIYTEAKSSFLEKGSEEDAQDALVNLAIGVKKITGGYFEIDPFYGAVKGTRLTTLVPSSARLDYALSMCIYLTNNGKHFYPELTREYRRARQLGTDGQRHAYSQYKSSADRINPNHENRDVAIERGLRKAWDEEFKKFNGGRIPFPMQVSPSSIVKLMDSLESEGIKTINISRVDFMRLDPRG